MSKNTRILTDIAFKKLSNATITNPGNSEFQEDIKTNIQLGTNTIFGQTPPSTGLPTTLFDTSSNSIVQYVELDLVAVGAGNYDADSFSGDSSAYDDVDGGAALINHTYVAHLPSSYQTEDGSNSNSTSQNPLAGTGLFTNGAYLSGSGGTVQLVPPSYGLGYQAVVLDNTDAELNIAVDAQDFYIDYYSGVVFRQDGSASPYPTKLRAYIYIGKYAEEVIADATVASSNPNLHEVLTVGNSSSLSVSLSASAGAVSLISSGGLVDFSNASNVTTGLLTASYFKVTSNADIDGNLNVDGNFKVDGNVILGTDNTNVVTITGDLIVQGDTTTIETANMVVEDQFILLNSGSSTGADTGIIVQRDIHPDSGSALYFDQEIQTWAVDQIGANAVANSAVHDVHLATVQVNNTSPSSDPLVGVNATADSNNLDGRLGQIYVHRTGTDGEGNIIYIFA